MNKLLTLIAVLAVFAVGCGTKGDGNDHADATHEAESGDHSQAEVADTPMTNMAHGQEVTLTGSLGCGHCTFHEGDSCSAAMETTEGVVFILDGIDEESEVFQKRQDGGKITVVGTVLKGFPPHIDVKSYTM